MACHFVHGPKLVDSDNIFLKYIHLCFCFDWIEMLFCPIKVVANRRKFVGEKKEKDDDITS